MERSPERRHLILAERDLWKSLRENMETTSKGLNGTSVFIAAVYIKAINLACMDGQRTQFLRYTQSSGINVYILFMNLDQQTRRQKLL
jgi:hypothetical protein